MSINTAYIDDRPQDLMKYKERFQTDDRSAGKFEITTYVSPKSSEDIAVIEQQGHELIMIDFELTVADEDNKVTGISGLGLATELRQKLPEIPLVLLTRESVFRIREFSDKMRTLSCIDGVFYKEKLFKPDSTELDSLFALARGFKELRDKTERTWASLLGIVDAPDIDNERLKLSNPPIGSDNRWSVSDAADWIRNILIKFPGLLYDSIHSATFLGISESAFVSEPIQSNFSNARYNGPFADSYQCWWKSRLQERAQSIMTQDERDLHPREGFARAWARVHDMELEKSQCVFSGKAPAEWVCYILKKPVMIEYSLSYYPDARPSVMDEARVSFKAIRTSNEVNDELFDILGQELLPKIRS